ncbi:MULTISPECIES: ABC transporter substrate-binding protein [unclassified Frankia]|uniref:ABC transporter substrate-binding protein n=1 Tax=unclassified Frankia TaxID=2632575 RepID=UPI002AD271ED|nr:MULTISPECIES: ABC transporter substrate-binding protein [unclassified Frankia]
MQLRFTFRRRHAVALVIVVLAAGCGTSDARNALANTGCQTPGVNPTTVKLGLLFPNSGPAAPQFADFRAGVDARFGLANSQGGVGGRKLTYDWEDDASDPATNLAAATRLVDSSQDFAVIESSNVSTSSAAYLHDNAIPVIGSGAEAAWSENDNMFTWSQYLTAGPAPLTWGNFARTRGGRKAAVLRIAFNEASSTFAQKMTESLKAAGIDVVYTDQISVTGTDLTGIVTKIKNSGADVLTGGLTVDAFAGVVAAANRAQIPLKVAMSAAGYDQSVLRAYGPKLAGTYLFVNVAPFEENLPVHRTFIDAMAAYAPQTQPPTRQVALTGWISADMLLRGLQAAGPCPTRQSFITHLRNVHDYAADGLVSPPVDLAKYGEVARCYTFLQINPTGSAFAVQQPAPYCGS